jgi:glycosyltransferase involved in cell wall biosynthesis
VLHLFYNALAASAGSGLTYVRNVAPCLERRADVRATFLLSAELASEMLASDRIQFVTAPNLPGAARRFLWEQREIPRLVQQHQADVLVSAGNFAVRRSPIPQILLSGNSLYTSEHFRRDLRKRREYGLLLDNALKTSLAARSIRWADVTVAPSQAFAADLRRLAPGNITAIHHGFDREVFFADPAPLPAPAQQLQPAANSLRLLFVSHYNYYRNFETLFRALPLIRAKLPERNATLILTTRLRSEDNPGSFRAEPAAALVRELGITDHVIELGAIPYRHLHQLYQACDLYVTAAYTETFAHPLVEAMACGKPIVASDLPVHREIAQDAAAYFATFSPEALADQIVTFATHRETANQAATRALDRAKDFSWDQHVHEMVTIAADLVTQEKKSHPDRVVSRNI